ncbi:hypothetical protein Microterr_19640 [Microbacterium terricola]|uniref:DUF559 domain-containing protein n=2 Tax=Microbacterium terricola TaxID=344163 RepID=A0ABM8E061_9MICO|nr:hypothetical protein Microterr_19640 [Microbacterium terricola]
MLRRGVYASAGACLPLTEAVAHGGVLGCVSAARHLGLWVLDDSADVHVWMHRNGRRHHPRLPSPCGCTEHWDDGPPVDSFGTPSVPRVLRQILSCRGVEEFFVALESALRQRLLTAEGHQWLHTHTNEAARAAMRLARSDADSGLESLVRWRLRGHGLRVCTQAEVFGVGRVDLLVGDRLIIEVDGRDNHDDTSHRHKDLVRDAHAAAWGYRTLRFDYAMVVHDWDLVEAAILGALWADGAGVASRTE